MRITILGLLVALYGLTALAETPVIAEPTIVREAILEKGRSPDAMVIERANDGGYVIAGRIRQTKSAWATKTNAAGDVVWRYLLGSEVEPSLAAARPVFTGAAGTDDAGTLLCGSMGADQSGNVIVDGVVVVLDSEGKLVNKQVVAPPPSGEIAHLAYFKKCARWGDGFVAVGDVSRYFETGQPQRRQELYHWIVEFDRTGAVRWQRLIQPKLPSIATYSPIRMMSNQDILVAAISNTDTEVIRLSHAGEVRASTTVPGRRALVLPSADNEDVKLLGCYGIPGTGALIRLHHDLKPDRDMTLPLSPGYSCGPDGSGPRIYQLGDGAIVMFGFRSGHGQDSASATQWNSSGTTETIYLLQHPRAYWVSAAIPTMNAGEFATIRTLRRSNAPGDSEAQSGALLSIIKLD